MPPGELILLDGLWETIIVKRAPPSHQEQRMPSPEAMPTVAQPDRRKLIAILFADMVGFSRHVGADDVGTFERLRVLRQTLFDPMIADHGGKLVQTAGDSLLVVFDSIDGALCCAIAIQQKIPSYDGDLAPDAIIRFRIGINIGDVIANDTDLYGDDVNVAARLQAVCPEGAVCVSRAIRDHAHARLGVEFDRLGELSLKNIARPVEAFVVRCAPRSTVARQAWLPPQIPPGAKKVYARRGVMAGITAIMAAGGGSIASLLPGNPENSPVRVQRTALVVGNGRYKELEQLANTERDAARIAAALESRGFHVMQRIDVDREALVQAITDFETTLSVVGGIGCFYYAGTAVHVGGTDVILPIDAHMDWSQSKIFGGVDFTRLSTAIQAKTTRHVADNGSVIIYSASKGQKASDGPPGQNSPFTQAFLGALDYDEDLSDLFRRIRVALEASGDSRQTPYFEDSRSARLYMNRPKNDPDGVLRILIFDSCRDNPFGAVVDAA